MRGLVKLVHNNDKKNGNIEITNNIVTINYDGEVRISNHIRQLKMLGIFVIKG